MIRSMTSLSMFLLMLLCLTPSTAEAAHGVAVKASKSGDRYSRVEATIRRENLGGGTVTNSAARAYVQTLGCRQDEAGHIIARQLGGDGRRHSRNIFPINSRTNHPEMFRMERFVRDLLEEENASQPSGFQYSHVDIRVSFTYGDRERPLRPTRLVYAIKGHAYDGRDVSDSHTFNNPKPSNCEWDDTDPREEERRRKQAEEELKTITREANDLMEDIDDLRTAGGEAVDELIEMICELDMEERGDAVTRQAERAADQLRRKVEDHFDDIERDFNKINDVVEELLDDPHVGDEVADLWQKLSRSWRHLEDIVDSKTFLKRGRSNPIIQAKFQWNWQHHRDMQFDRGRKCDSNATYRVKGSDCVSLEHCTVWEFGPDSQRLSDLRSRASKMARNANSTFRSRPEAAHCFAGRGRGFTTDVATYKACKP